MASSAAARKQLEGITVEVTPEELRESYTEAYSERGRGFSGLKGIIADRFHRAGYRATMFSNTEFGCRKHGATASMFLPMGISVMELRDKFDHASPDDTDRIPTDAIDAFTGATIVVRDGLMTTQ